MRNQTPKSYLVGRGVKTLADGGKIRIKVIGPRRQFVVTNICGAGTGANLYIAGPDQVPALVALPQLPITLETDSEFWLVNDSTLCGSTSATITYVVGELFNIGFGSGGNVPKGGAGNAGSDAGSSGGAGGLDGGEYNPPGSGRGRFAP
jgi:hypothetical protein